MIETPTYEQIANALAQTLHFVTPAELHGLFCGIICMGNYEFNPEEDELVRLEFQEGADSVAINALLNQLFEYTLNKIQHFELDFHLLLPDEETPLIDRAVEFGKWCEGFVLGLSTANPIDYYQADEVKDLLDNIQASTEIDYSTLGYSEEDETFFLEVVHFCKMSVFSIYQELKTEGSAIDSSSKPAFNLMDTTPPTYH